MRSRRALLSLQPFPDAVSGRVLEGACTLAIFLGAELTVQVPELNSAPSSWPAVIGAFPPDLPDIMDALVARSQANAAAAADAITKVAAEYGVPVDLRRVVNTTYADPSPVVDLARMHDLVILPVPESEEFGRSCVKAVLFDSGRPVILIPSQGRELKSLDRIVIAWDFSREAARALVDALPLLERAREVRIVTVTGEKEVKDTAGLAELEKLLSGHDLHYSLHEIALEGGPIGRFLMNYAVGVDADLLVMGGYGHSRLREFVLGGATRDILHDTLLPVLMSH